MSSFWEITETFWRWKRIVLTEHCAVCPLRVRRTDCCSLPITLGFALALGRNCSLSHLLIQSECAFLPQGIHQGIIEGDFALCISLYHGYELLLQMGIRSLFIYLWGIMDGAKGEMSFLPAPLLSHLARCMAERMRACRCIWCFAPFIPLFGGAKGILSCPTSLQRFIPHQERAGAKPGLHGALPAAAGHVLRHCCDS